MDLVCRRQACCSTPMHRTSPITKTCFAQVNSDAEVKSLGLENWAVGKTVKYTDKNLSWDPLQKSLLGNKDAM